MIIEGRAHVLGSNIDTDIILPGQYLTVTDPIELGRHAFEGMKDPEYHVSSGDIIIAGENFGCGSSREHAPVAIREAGARAVVAKSFARIYFRNSINVGLPALESDTTSFCVDGDDLRIDLGSGTIKNLVNGNTIRFIPLPQFIMDILEAGGLVNHVKATN